MQVQQTQWYRSGLRTNEHQAELDQNDLIRRQCLGRRRGRMSRRWLSCEVDSRALRQRQLCNTKVDTITKVA